MKPIGSRESTILALLRPSDIQYLQFPEHWSYDRKKLKDIRTRTLDGDWDNINNFQSVYWSGVYEIKGSQSSMVPIENYIFYRSCKDHFHGNIQWDKTDWVRWMVDREKQNQPISRYENQHRIAERLRMLESLYHEFNGRAKDIVDTCTFLALKYTKLRRFIVKSMDVRGLPVVNIGRGGRFSIEDGRHRLVIAKISNIHFILVRINAVHPKASLQVALRTVCI